MALHWFTKLQSATNFSGMYFSQFYIQLVFEAPLCITLMISDQKIVSGSLFFQLFQKKNKKTHKIYLM